MESSTLLTDKFQAMGSYVEIALLGNSKQLAYARHRINLLESKWSRFLPYSEISQLNNAQGQKIDVSADTIDLLEKGLEGFELSNGVFDPTIYGAILRAGYDRSFEEIRDSKENFGQENDFKRGMKSLKFFGKNTVQLDKNVGFDPGGIGKGLTADKVAKELRELGAAAVMINMGGDLRIVNDSDSHLSFDVDICDADEKIIESIVLVSGALATSTTQKRRWALNIDGEILAQQHIIHPFEDVDFEIQNNLVSVIGDEAYKCEILCKELLLSSRQNQFELVDDLGYSALVRKTNSQMAKSERWCQYE